MKSYTDINQSKKLAEILPLESADMCINSTNPYMITHELRPYGGFDNEHDPCWSLAALLDVLKDNIKIEKTQLDQSDIFTYSIVGDGYNYRTYEHEELIDACVEMIVKLHESNKLVS